jgi:hypothetical protein
MIHARHFAACALAGLMAGHAWAGVSADEAAKLKTALTPFGAERAGNKDGTIPAWEGGETKVPAGYKSGDPRPDPYANEKPLFSVTAKNMAAYDSHLSEGTKALLQKYPEQFRIDVYPTHRTAAAPQWVYDNTFRNATRATLKEGGDWIAGAYGGIPFPIPKNGAEAMWNHLLAWVGSSTLITYQNWIGLADGRRSLAAKGFNLVQYPYYDPAGSLEKFNGEYELLRVAQTEPPYKAGEQVLAVDSVDAPRQAWQYISGQRRVRKGPTIGYDTPDDVTGGQMEFDEAFNFWGPLDRYDWKLVGKKEIYIPYNTAKVMNAPLEKQSGPVSLNPDLVRWELHRVWVVEADLLPGKRHSMPKRRFYLDEDTWGAVLTDGYDAHGSLWHVGMTMPFVVPEGPFVHPKLFWTVFNLLAGTHATAAGPDFSKGQYMKVADKMLPESSFTPDALAGEAVR